MLGRINPIILLAYTFLDISSVNADTTTSTGIKNDNAPCVDRGNNNHVYSNKKFVGMCEWAGRMKVERCKEICPCGENVGTYLYELCPLTCGTCETAIPSSSPSVAPSVHLTAPPTICADKEDCLVVGDNNRLVQLCDIAKISDAWCDIEWYGGMLVKDVCRHTCFMCRSRPAPDCEDLGFGKEVSVKGKNVPLCEWAGIRPRTRCAKKCPCCVDEETFGQETFVHDICKYTCDNCSTPSGTPTISPSVLPTQCMDYDKCWAIPDGNTIIKLCDYAAQYLERCTYETVNYVTPESMPDFNAPYIRDICRKTCNVCKNGGADHN